MRAPSLALALLVLASDLSAAEPKAEPLAFVGILSAPKRTMIMLAEGKETRWVELGGQYGEYLVASYDAAADLLTLSKPDGQVVRLPLKDSKVQAATNADSDAAQRRALWEKIKNLDGADLIQELTDRKDRSSAAFTYLGEQYDRMQKEAAAAKLAWEQETARAPSTADDRVRLMAAQQKYTVASKSVITLLARLEQLALHRKKELRDSLAAP